MHAAIAATHMQALVTAPPPQPQPAPEPAPSAHSSGSAGGVAASSMLPSGSVEKLLALELEVGARPGFAGGAKTSLISARVVVLVLLAGSAAHRIK